MDELFPKALGLLGQLKQSSAPWSFVDKGHAHQRTMTSTLASASPADSDWT